MIKKRNYLIIQLDISSFVVLYATTIPIIFTGLFFMPCSGYCRFYLSEYFYQTTISKEKYFSELYFYSKDEIMIATTLLHIITKKLNGENNA